MSRFIHRYLLRLTLVSALSVCVGCGEEEAAVSNVRGGAGSKLKNKKGSKKRSGRSGQSGEKTEDEILAEFLDTFEDHYCDMKGHADARDGTITMQEWLEYYNNVSMSIDNDEYFQLMMNNTWNLDGKRVTKKGWGGEF